MGEVTSEVDEEITKQDAWMEPLPEPLLIILSPPPPFLPRPGKPTMVWQKWLKAFEHYVEALGENDLSDSSKCVLIQNCLGPEGQHIYTTLFQSETTYTAAISGLTVYFTSDPTSQMYRLIFHHRAQMPAETVDQFVFALTELLRPCNYGVDLEAKLILDQLIKKTNCPQLGERLLLERETMTLDKAMVISKEVESALNESTMFGVHEVSVDIGDDLDPPVPIKYKRGRPRRGEERPKKTITEEVSVDIGDDLDLPLPIKRKRGRPRLGEERPKKTLTKTKPCLITPTRSSKPCLKKTRGRPSRYRDNDCNNSDNLCFSENYGDKPKTVNETNPACDTANDKAAAAADDQDDDDDDDDDVVDKDDDDYRPFSTSEPIEEDYQDQGSDAEDYKTTSGTRTKLKGPYCPICIDRRFKSAHKLARHMRMHTKEKPFCCPHCPVTFSQSYHMTRHLRNQHGAGQHVCSTCGENQGSLEELKIHKRTHVPKALSCPVCNQIFTSNAAFMAHTVSHCMQTLGHSSQQSDELENRETIASCDEGNGENDDSDEDGAENDADSDFTVPIVKKSQEKSRKGKAASKVGTEGHFCPHCPERRFKGSNKLARHMRTHTKEKPFSCPECSLSFSQSYHMTRHLRKQHGSGKYICTKCGKSLNSWLELKTHRKTHAVEGLTCLACDKQFKEKAELVKHLKLHKKVQASPRSLVCGDCGKVFGRMYHLKRHIVTHRKATNGECYTCPNCQKTFAFPEDLNKHLEIHVMENSGTCPKCNENFGSPEELEAHMGVHEKSYACSVCGKKFKVEYALKKHEQGHQNEQYYCELCCKRFVKLSHYRRHIMVHNRRETRCPHCDSVFLKVNALKYHLRTHTEERPYQCTGCIETFVEAEDLEQHRLKHRKFKKERPYSCTRCDCAYSTLIELTEHMSQHEGEQPQNCPVCGKSFLNKNKLEKHLSIHTGERPHLCSICGNGFPSAASLKLHAYIHTGEKPFQCSQCSKTFSSSSGLRLHGRQHMEVRPTFICPECGRTYGRMTELKMHQRYHTGDKPYACTCCNKRFISKDKLNVHMRIHTGERPYSCPHCGQTFTQTGDRNRHISKFHDGLATELF